MKRASYRDAIDFIAYNDEPEWILASEIDGMASVVLIASIFGVESMKVAEDVARYRIRKHIVNET